MCVCLVEERLGLSQIWQLGRDASDICDTKMVAISRMILPFFLHGTGRSRFEF
jgi:hypothetical protein